jgi:predicted XRE-type DNA-binding protein
MVKVERSSGNVFKDLGFDDAEAEALLAKSEMALAIKRLVAARGLTQIEAAKLCRTDQPTLSKVLGGRLEGITMDRLSAWLRALGARVEISVKPGRAGRGRLVVNA